MKRVFAGAAVCAITAALASPAFAVLEIGAAAPEVVAEGALAGEAYHFDLAEARAEGPVVLYFFPAAFTPGCNIEAGLFSQAIADFEAQGATVVGVTGGAAMDDSMSAFASSEDEMQERLLAFSSEHCQDAFAVAGVDAKTITAYDVASARAPGGAMSNRTSYVISPEGEVLFVHSDNSPEAHISSTLEAVKTYNAAHGGE